VSAPQEEAIVHRTPSSTHRLFTAAVVIGALALGACGDDSADSDASGGTQAVATSAGQGAADTTAGGSGTTAPDSPPADADATAQARVQAALDTLPADWTGTIADDLGNEGNSADDIVFIDCLTPDDYNLDHIDWDSAASWELDATGPQVSAFGEPQASLEARIFSNADAATAAYAVLERIVGTDDGRECLEEAVPGQLAADAPGEAQIDARVEGTTIEGADVGARIVISVTVQGMTTEVYVDLVAAHPDATGTIFATFVSFEAPLDQAVASAMMLAAINA
jgi:hypothetical protein